jgi:hypothetical protein
MLIKLDARHLPATVRRRLSLASMAFESMTGEAWLPEARRHVSGPRRNPRKAPRAEALEVRCVAHHQAFAFRLA